MKKCRWTMLFVLCAVLVATLVCAAGCKKDVTAKLTLDAGQYGTLAVQQYDVPVGASLKEFLADKTPACGEHVYFDCWLNNGQPITDELVMPQQELKLSARYLADYTVGLYRQQVDGTYGAAESVTGRAVAWQPFEYVPNEQHFAVDKAQANSLRTDSLQPNQQFSAYLKRDVYMVSFFANAPQGEDVQGEMTPQDALYGQSLQLPQGEFECSRAYRFAGWSRSADGPVQYSAGQEFSPEEDTMLYAVWNKGLVDLFGGSDLLFVWGNELVLDRVSSPEQRTELGANGQFSFENGLQGKVVGAHFYYYRDTVEKTYPSFEGTQEQLTLLAGGKANYRADADAEVLEGTYDVEESGVYLFEGAGTRFAFRLESTNEGVAFRKRGEEFGYYIPSATEAGKGVRYYYLDGFDGGTEFYGASAPYTDPYTEATATELPIEYGVADETEGVVTYYIVSEFDGLTVNAFTFRAEADSSVVEGQTVRGKCNRGDGNVGHYKAVDCQYGELYIDGYGNALLGTEQGTYVTHSQRWVFMDIVTGQQSSANDFWIEFRVDGKTKYRLRPDVTDGDYTYTEITADVFGTYRFENDVTLFGEQFSNVFVYVYGDGRALMLADGISIGGVAVYYMLDMSLYTFEANAQGVYTFEFNGVQVKLSDGSASLLGIAVKPVVLLDGDEKLEVAEDGNAYFTAKGGTATKVDFTYETGVIDVYTVTVGKQDVRVFGVLYDYMDSSLVKHEVYVIPFTQVLEHNEDQQRYDYWLRLLVCEDFGALGMQLTDGTYGYFAYGKVTASGGEFRFEQRSMDDALPSELENFRYTVSGSSFVLVTQQTTYTNSDGQVFTLDGLSTATLTQQGQRAEYRYEEYARPAGGEFVLYALTSFDDEGDMLYVKVAGNSFKVIDERASLEVGYYYELEVFYMGSDDEEYIFLDGDGMAIWYSRVGEEEQELLATYTVNNNYSVNAWTYSTVYDLTFKGAAVAKRTVAVGITSDGSGYYGVYLEQNAAQLGEYQIEGGGLVKGDGFCFSDNLGLFNTATYTDENGNSHDGIMRRGNIDASAYNKREFTEDAEGDVVLFTLITLDGDSVLVDRQMVLDVTEQQGKILLVEREGFYGTFREIVEGISVDNTLYLDGHGHAILTENGEEKALGYEKAPEMDEYAYRLFDDNKVTVAYVALITTVDVSASDGYDYEFARYKEGRKHTYTNDDWEFMQLDGYALATYTDKYGVVREGVFGFVTEGILAFYPDDQSGNRYFKVDDGKLQRLQNGFYVEDGVLVLYLGEEQSITLPDNVEAVQTGAFRFASSVTHVDFNNVTEIRDEAFAYSSIEEVRSEKILTVGNRAFAHIATLQTVYLPNALSIGVEAFFGSRVTSITLGAVQTVGDRAFSHYRATDTMELDLSAVADAAKISWGQDVFTSSNGSDGLDTNYLISVVVILKDIQTLNTMYAQPTFSKLRGCLSLPYGEEDGNVYFGFDSQEVYILSHGLLYIATDDYIYSDDIDELLASAYFVADVPVALYCMQGEKLCLFSLNADGSGYNTTPTPVGDANSFVYNDMRLWRAFEDITLDVQGVQLSITLDCIDYYEKIIAATVTYGSEQPCEGYLLDGTLLFARGEDLYALAYDGTVATAEQWGTLRKAATERNTYRAELLVRNDGTVYLYRFEFENVGSPDEEDWYKYNILGYELLDDHTLLAATGSSRYSAVYYAIDFSAENLDVSYYGIYAYGSDDSSKYTLYCIFDEDTGEIKRIEEFRIDTAAKDYQLVKSEGNTVVLRVGSTDYIISLTPDQYGFSIKVETRPAAE